MRKPQLIAMQKELTSLENKINETAGDLNPHTQAYLERARHLPSVMRQSSSNEVLTDIHSADIIYIGDYHHMAACQDTEVKILKKMIAEKVNFGLGMELVFAGDQKVLDAYMHDEIHEINFLGAINYSEAWGYPWAHFRRIFELAKENNIPVFGIDSKRVHNPLKRDSQISKRLVRLVDKVGKLAVIFGNAHLHPEHLPKEVEKLGYRGKQLVISQDNENVFLEAGKKRLENSRILKLKDGNYNIINTSPIIVKHGELMWTRGQGSTSVYFKSLTRDIINYILDELEISTEEVGKFPSVLTSERSLRKRISGEELERFEGYSESMYFPESNVIFLVDKDMITLSEEAMHFVHHQYSSPNLNLPHHTVDSFYIACMNEAFGEFGSRLVTRNKERISQKKLKEMADSNNELQKSIAKYVDIHNKMDPSCLTTPSLVTGLISFTGEQIKQGVIHVLGYRLGDALYQGFMNGKLSLPDFKKLLKTDFHQGETAFHLYNDLREQF